MILTALVTGLVFAKFSRSTARMVFAREAVIGGATIAATPLEMRLDPKGGATTAGNVIVTYPSGTSWRVEVNIPGRVRSCMGTTTCP